MGLQKVKVPGDGSCWLYAFLVVTLRIPEAKRPNKALCDAEKVVRMKVCDAMTVFSNDFKTNHHRRQSGSFEDETPDELTQRIANMRRSPIYEYKRHSSGVQIYECTQSGKEASQDEIACLCWIYNVDCVIWTKGKEDYPNWQFTVCFYFTFVGDTTAQDHTSTTFSHTHTRIGDLQ